MGSSTKDFTRAKGNVSIVVTDSKSGIEKDRREIHNMVVDTGLEYIISRMASANIDVMSHMALGSGDTPEDGDSTDLETALGPRQSLSSTQIVDSGLGVNDSIRYNAAWFEGESLGTINEAALFNNGTSGQGIMLARTTFPTVIKQQNDILTVEWTITLEPDYSSSSGS
jgi:hypothetical protein